MQDEQIVVFQLAGEHYAVPIANVREIIISPHITEIPKTKDYIEGIMSLRGKVITVINIKKMLGLREKEHVNKDEQRIVILEKDEVLIGIEVDSVHEVMNVSENGLELPPLVEKQYEGGKQYLKGIVNMGKELLLILDVERIFDL